MPSSSEAENVDWKVLVQPEAGIAEIPIYDVTTDALYWMSLKEPSLNRTKLSDRSTTSWTLPAEGGSYALYDDGRGALVAVADGIYDLDFETGDLNLVHHAPYDRRTTQFNDGRCDRAGRFWVGTMRIPHVPSPNGTGFFYRFSDGLLERVIGGVTMANGIAFAPDSHTMYLADRVNDRILAYDYDLESGTPSHERIFTKIGHGEIADGAAVDRRGGYWTTLFKSGQIRRYSPEGELTRVITTPVSQPTMCAFGGRDLDRLFVTTARAFLTEQQLALEPLAGSILYANIGERGLPEPRFPRQHPTDRRYAR